jgi:hypothetical protein
MKVVVTFVLLICTFSIAMGQGKTFTYSKLTHVERFLSEKDTIILSYYREVKHGIKERLVSMNNISYKIVIYHTKKGPVKEVLDNNGNKVAAITLSGPEKNTILFQDSAKFKWQSTSKFGWAFLKDEKEVIKSFYYMMDTQKYFVVQPYDSVSMHAIMPIVALDYWTSTTHKYPNKKNTTVLALAGFAAVLAVIRVAVDADSN